MTDPSKDNQDTVNDLRKAIEKDHKKTLAVVEKAEKAVITLVVQGREQALKRTILGNGSPDCTVRVRFRFKATETDMSGSAANGGAGGGPWRRAAAKVADQVDQWVIANRGQLAEAIK